jgi:hypothetical protein
LSCEHRTAAKETLIGKRTCSGSKIPSKKKQRQDQYGNEIEAQILARSTKQQTGHA